MLSEAGPDESNFPQNTGASGRRARLSFTRKLSFSVVVSLAFFGVLELILAAAGVRRILCDASGVPPSHGRLD